MNEVFARKHLLPEGDTSETHHSVILCYLFAIFLFHEQDVQLTVSPNNSQFVDPQYRNSSVEVIAFWGTMVKGREIVRRDRSGTDRKAMTDEE